MFCKMVNDLIVRGICTNNLSGTQNPCTSVWGVYTMYSSLMKMQLTGSEKLVFIASFMVLMNWGVRVASLLINNLL